MEISFGNLVIDGFYIAIVVGSVAFIGVLYLVLAETYRRGKDAAYQEIKGVMEVLAAGRKKD